MNSQHLEIKEEQCRREEAVPWHEAAVARAGRGGGQGHPPGPHEDEGDHRQGGTKMKIQVK